MKAILTEGSVIVRRVTITKYRGIIMVNIDTTEKWPSCSYSSTHGPGDYESRTIQLENTEPGHDSPWTSVELIPGSEDERLLMKNCFLTLASNRYGPTYLFTPMPTDEEMEDMVDVFEDASDAERNPA